jgi:hypothetical protein
VKILAIRILDFSDSNNLTRTSRSLRIEDNLQERLCHPD